MNWWARLENLRPLPLLVAFFAITFPLWSNAYLSPPDSASYLAVARTITHGGNLDFREDYQVLEFEWYFYYLTDQGRISNDWPIGSGLLWLPPYAAAHVIATGAHALGVEGRTYGPDAPARHLLLPRPIGTGMHEPLMAPSGKSGIYKLFVTLWVAAMAVAALWLGIALAAPHTGRGRALLAAFLVLLGTPVGFYVYAFAMMSHIPSMLMAGLLVWGWQVTRGGGRTLPQWAGLGAVAGVMVMVRPQDGVFLAVFLVEALMDRQHLAGRWKSWLVGVAIAGCAALVAFLPQMITWWTLYGHPLQLPKIEEMHWFRPRLLDTLFSEYHGILSWSPLLALLPVGAWVLWRRDRTLAVALMLVVLIQVWLNAANEIWWSGGSFGNRRMVACGVPFVVLVAAALGVARLRYILPVAVVLALWNFLLWAAERGGLLSLDHFVPWDGAFLRNVLSVALPWRTFHAMLGDFAGFGWITRMVLMAGGLALAIWLARTTFPFQRLQRPVVVVAVSYITLLAILFPVLAARTPVHTEADFDIPPPRRNLSLFNGYYEYGFFNLVKGRIEQAEAAYLKANALLPGHPNPYRYLATIQLRHRGDAAAALQLAGMGLDIQPNYPGLLMEMETAVGILLPRSPEPNALLENLAVRWERAGNPERAGEIRGMKR
jgi:hypothetical protein